LAPGDQQPDLTRLPLETPLYQTRNVVDEETECAIGDCGSTRCGALRG
jgi:hypothetical protein